MIPRKLVKRLVKRNLKADVTADAIDFLQLQIEKEIRIICEKTRELHEHLNERYTEVGLHIKKRIGVEVFNKVLADAKWGVEADLVETTSISNNGVEMKEKTSAPNWQDVEVV